MLERTVAPYGAWRSLVRIEDVVGDVLLLGEPWVDGDDVYWLEGRPTEGGRRVLVRAAADGSTVDLTPPPFNVRTRVHEYGGGSYVVAGGVVVFSEFADNRLYRLDPGAAEAVPITPPGPWRYADLHADLGRRRFYAVREDHGIGGGSAAEVVNTLVAIPLDGGDATVLVSGPDFVSSPRLSPDGSQLAWLEWDHPDMPWDATRLRFAPIEPDGTLGEPALAAGGPDESIVQPEWAPDGTLHLISDRSGWWNLYRLVEGPRLEPLAPMEAEFADAAWIFGRSSYGFLPDGTIVAVGRHAGQDHLYHVAPGTRIGLVETPFSELDALQVGPAAIVALAGAPTDPWVVARFDPLTLAPAGVLRRASTVTLDPAAISQPEAIEFPTTGERTAHALYYPPTNPEFVAPEGERAAARRAVPWRPHVERADHARAHPAVPDQPRHRRRGRELRRQHGLRPRVPPPARRPVGDRRRRRLHRGGPLPGRRAATPTRGGWPSRAAAPAATRPSPRSRSATSSPRASATSGSATWSSSRSRPTSSNRTTTTGCSPRTRRPRPSIGSARRSTPPGTSRARSSCSRGSTIASSRRRRPRRWWRRWPPTASRTPTSRSRARAMASAARSRNGERSRPACRSSARSSASSRPTSSSRSRCVGLAAWRERHPLHRPAAPVAAAVEESSTG